MYIDTVSGPYFLREGCSVLGSKVCELLTLAGLDVTLPAIVDIVSSLPRSYADLANEYWKQQACNYALETAYDRCKGTPNVPRCYELMSYFLEYLPGLDRPARELLGNAFIGVLKGLELTPVGPLALTDNRPASPERAGCRCAHLVVNRLM